MQRGVLPVLGTSVADQRARHSIGVLVVGVIVVVVPINVAVILLLLLLSR